MTKTNAGFFFEDYVLDQVLTHAVPRTLSGGERALYHALYPARGALHSSDSFARACGLASAPMDDLAVFHTVFGKSVPDISLNAVANLGYAEGRWLRPVWPGQTITAESRIIGLKQTSSGKTGIVWVRTTGFADDAPCLSYVRWVMVRRRGDGPAPPASVPVLADRAAPGDLVLPEGLDFTGYDSALAGEPFRLGDYTPGETIDHVDGVTVEEAEHMMATRLWQNTARVHFDGSLREDGRRLVYGGHVMSLARALSFNGLANAQMIVALNGGAHANPCFAGDTVRAWSEVLETAATGAPGVGAIRLRLVATRGQAGALRADDGRYLPEVLLDLDYWALMPV